MIDIFTLERIVTATEEHILPRCLGGRLAKVGLIDKTTNDETGHMIDAKLDEALRSIRVITGAMSSDGQPPRSLASVIGDDGKQYTVAVDSIFLLPVDRCSDPIPEQFHARSLASGFGRH